MSEQIFTTENFNKEVLLSEELVLVDFWAPWCGPCRMMAPIVEELATEMRDKKVKIGKLNVDENAEIAGEYKIMSIPAIFIFKEGAPLEKVIGMQSKEVLKQKLEEYLS